MTGFPRDRDIIIEAINSYDEWMLDEDYEPRLVLTRIIQRMRDRIVKQNLDAMAGAAGLNDEPDYKAWYDEAIKAANTAGYGPCSAAEAIEMINDENAALVAENRKLLKALKHLVWRWREYKLGPISIESPHFRLVKDAYDDWQDAEDVLAGIRVARLAAAEGD